MDLKHSSLMPFKIYWVIQASISCQLDSRFHWTGCHPLPILKLALILALTVTIFDTWLATLDMLTTRSVFRLRASECGAVSCFCLDWVTSSREPHVTEIVLLQTPILALLGSALLFSVLLHYNEFEVVLFVQPSPTPYVSYINDLGILFFSDSSSDIHQ